MGLWIKLEDGTVVPTGSTGGMGSLFLTGTVTCGNSAVSVTFAEEFDNPPNITCTPVDSAGAVYVQISNITTTGFSIETQGPVVDIFWQATEDDKVNHFGAVGATGAPGQDGQDGKDGQDGQDGKDGEDGKDGLNGFPGAPGPPGADFDGEHVLKGDPESPPADLQHGQLLWDGEPTPISGGDPDVSEVVATLLSRVEELTARLDRMEGL